jgi:hypothetical protein
MDGRVNVRQRTRRHLHSRYRAAATVNNTELPFAPKGGEQRSGQAFGKVIIGEVDCREFGVGPKRLGNTPSESIAAEVENCEPRQVPEGWRYAAAELIIVKIELGECRKVPDRRRDAAAEIIVPNAQIRERRQLVAEIEWNDAC